MDEYTPRRTVVFLVSLAVMALGVVLSAKSGLGTTPISSIPLVASLGSDLFTLGTATMAMNVVFIIIGILIMRRDYRAWYLLEFFLISILAVMCDVLMILLDFVSTDDYLVQWALSVVSALIMAFGLSLEVAADFSMLPGDRLVEFIGIRTGMVFGNVKILFDISMIVTAVALSFLFFGLGEFNGIREGTIFTALTVGAFTKFFTRLLKKGFYGWVGRADAVGAEDRRRTLFAAMAAWPIDTPPSPFGTSLWSRIGWSVAEARSSNILVITAL